MKHLKKYEIDDKICTVWNTPTGKQHVYTRAERYDVTVKKRGQSRRGTWEIVPFDINQPDVDSRWQGVMIEKGVNLYHYLPCSPSQLLKTTHAGAILDLGEK